MQPRPLSELTADSEQLLSSLLGRASAAINCCLPGVVKRFDPETQTAQIQPTIRRRIRTPRGVQEMDYPLLTDVPVLMLGGGQHFFTMPVAVGDECIVLFSDGCMDAWYQSGGVQNPILARAHDLSDGFAIVGFRSKPNAIKDMNTTYPEISDMYIAGKRFEDWISGAGGVSIEFEDDTETLGIDFLTEGD